MILRSSDLAHRWKGLNVSLSVGDEPFGRTAQGLKDFRAVPLNSRGPLIELNFDRCDLSFADISNVRLQDCTFRECLFSKTSFAHVKERRCQFIGCHFKGVDFRSASLGLWTSRFDHCVIEAPRIGRYGFINPIFEHCEFRGLNVSTADLGCSGFWDCSISGSLSDVILRGRDVLMGRLAGLESPRMTGLHNVDFSHARLSSFSLRHGCKFEGIKLPLSGCTFAYKSRVLVGAADQVRRDLGDRCWEAFCTVIQFVRFDATDQEIGLFCKTDFGTDIDNAVSEQLFNYLKLHFGLGSPYVIS